MTPRQLSAFELLEHWESEAHFAALANVVRAAHHADENGFDRFIKKLTK